MKTTLFYEKITLTISTSFLFLRLSLIPNWLSHKSNLPETLAMYKWQQEFTRILISIVVHLKEELIFDVESTSRLPLRLFSSLYVPALKDKWIWRWKGNLATVTRCWMRKTYLFSPFLMPTIVRVIQKISW